MPTDHEPEPEAWKDPRLPENAPEPEPEPEPEPWKDPRLPENRPEPVDA